MLSGELKSKAIAVVQRIIAEVQTKRNDVGDDDVKKFTGLRKLAFDY